MQVPSITPLQAAAPLHGKPSHGTSRIPRPKAPCSRRRQGRGTQGLGRQLGCGRSSPDAEAHPGATLHDCKTETSLTRVVRRGMFTSPGGNTQLICTWFHPDLRIHQHPETGNPTGTSMALHPPRPEPINSAIPHTAAAGEAGASPGVWQIGAALAHPAGSGMPWEASEEPGEPAARTQRCQNCSNPSTQTPLLHIYI